MIYPPGYDATKPYQEIGYNGARIVVFNAGLADAQAPLIARYGEDVFRVLRSTECMPESEWLADKGARDGN